MHVCFHYIDLIKDIPKNSSLWGVGEREVKFLQYDTLILSITFNQSGWESWLFSYQ